MRATAGSASSIGMKAPCGCAVSCRAARPPRTAARSCSRRRRASRSWAVRARARSATRASTPLPCCAPPTRPTTSRRPCRRRMTTLAGWPGGPHRSAGGFAAAHPAARAAVQPARTLPREAATGGGPRATKRPARRHPCTGSACDPSRPAHGADGSRARSRGRTWGSPGGPEGTTLRLPTGSGSSRPCDGHRHSAPRARGRSGSASTTTRAPCCGHCSRPPGASACPSWGRRHRRR